VVRFSMGEMESHESCLGVYREEGAREGFGGGVRQLLEARFTACRSGAESGPGLVGIADIELVSSGVTEVVRRASSPSARGGVKRWGSLACC